MIAAGLIAFREGLEAALIVGIVVSYLRKTGQQKLTRYAWAGVALAILLSVVIAVGITALGMELEGTAEQLFEGVTILLAVGILTWMVFWMRYQSRTMKSTIEQHIQASIDSGSTGRRGLIAVTFLAVFREGVETALFLSAAAFATSEMDTLVGAIAGLLIAALVGYLIYGAALRLNLRAFFNVTSILLLVFAAGLFASGIHEFQEAGLLPIITEHLWNTNALIAGDSTLGEVLHTVVGYNASPSLLEVIGYWAYWAFALIGVRWLVDRRVERVQAPTTPVKAIA